MTTKPLSYSFPALVDAQASILILGSMPGVISLEQQQYYAHPRNAFWPIMADIAGFCSQADYSERCKRLIQNGIAVWDVLRACHRPGSLDQHIDESTVEANNFQRFVEQYPQITHIFFNGSKAEQIFNKRVLKEHETEFSHITFQRLPSTSPAHAALSLEQKQSIWYEAIDQARQKTTLSSPLVDA